MNRLQPHENELIGQLVESNGRIDGDEVCDRIDWLVTHVLNKIAFSPESGGWDTLFRDPTDGRLWERTYPQSHMHGGGPPALFRMTPEQARKKYGIELS